ncbi:MAG: glycosyltransferase family 4 protein [Candidatus Levyibacteriota bacterium]
MQKILFVTYDFPYPINSGGKSRAYHLMKFVKSADIEILLYSFTRPSYEVSQNEKLEEIGISKIFTHPRKPKNPAAFGKSLVSSGSVFKHLYFEETVADELNNVCAKEKIDSIIFESFYTAFYISEVLRKMGVKQIFGTENIEHMLYYDLAHSKSKILSPIYKKQVEKVRREEERAYREADTVLAVTPEEKEYIEQKTKTPVQVIPNGVDTADLSYEFKQDKGKNLLFVGNFAYFPNIDAMKFFYHEVFLKMPEAKMTVVGKHQDKLPFLIHDPRVQNIEYVDSLKKLYHDSDVFIFPVRFGGGTNFKVLEAASCGTPIIAIPDRVKGLGFQPEKHYIPAASAPEFIAGIERLFNHQDLRKTVSEEARALIEKKYDWKEIGRNLGKVLREI